MIKTLLFAAALLSTSFTVVAQDAFFNEFDYDQPGTDNGEFIEVAVNLGSCPGGCDISLFSVVLYNGSNPGAATTYSTTRTLPPSPTSMDGPYGLYLLNTPGVQNGGNDGFALVYGTTVLQLLSYEGVFTASEGPAAGMVSVDVGVQENNDAPNQATALNGATRVWELTTTPTPGQPNTPVGPLPIALVSFDATPAGAKANLKWVTASELDNAFFAVEVSRDGVDFREAGRVDGAGTSRESATYGFTYPAPAAGRYYFRLAQYDFDGQVNYSPVVTAELGRGGKKFGIASATYRSDELLVDAEDGAQLRIIDMRGAVISTVKLGASRQSIDVSGLPAGVYALTDGETAVRFVR